MVTSDGHLLEDRALHLCARCHAEARGDSLFGLPARDIATRELDKK
jgi:hypothetical protein